MIDCQQCQYWSDRIAKAHVGSPSYIEAFCLCANSPHYGSYTPQDGGCEHGQNGEPIDSYHASP